MTDTIFYSWQADLPNATNRSLIESALGTAATAITNDKSVCVEPVIDRDTAGVAGAPDIADTIFEKIERCGAFVADVSIITPNDARKPSPNPNVLVELGFAIRALGWNRTILVMNTHYGLPQLLPFDLRSRRVLTYASASDGAAKADVRRMLASRLEGQLRDIFTNSRDAQSPVGDAFTQMKDAVRGAHTGRKLVAREYLGRLDEHLLAFAPPNGGGEDTLLSSLDATTELVAEFAEVAEMVAVLGDDVTAAEIYASFGNLLRRYGNRDVTQVDPPSEFFRFLGHELFVTFVASLLREQQLSIIKRLLSYDLDVRDKQDRRLRAFHELQAGTATLWNRTRRIGLMSAHGALLHDRHIKEPLAARVGFDDFVGADYFLFLFAEATKSAPRSVPWFPPTAPYLLQSPVFLARLHRVDFASAIAEALGLPDIGALRSLIVDTELHLAQAFRLSWTRIREAYEPALIGSR